MFIDTSSTASLVELFDRYHLLSILMVFVFVGTLSVLGYALMFLFKIVEEVVTAFFKMCAACKAARQGNVVERINSPSI